MSKIFEQIKSLDYLTNEYNNFFEELQIVLDPVTDQRDTPEKQHKAEIKEIITIPLAEQLNDLVSRFQLILERLRCLKARIDLPNDTERELPDRA